MPDQLFQDRIARIEQKKRSSVPTEKEAPINRKIGKGWAILAGVQGFLAHTALLFTNANYDRFKADAVDVPQLKYVLIGLLLFIAVSYIWFLWSIIRRAFSAKARSKGWNPVIGFCFGVVVASMALRMAGGL